MSEEIARLSSSLSEALNCKDFTKTADLANAILKLEPGNLRAKEFLAYAAGNQGDKHGALKLLLEIAGVNNCPVSALYECGSLLLELGYSKKAIAPLERAHKLAPDSFEILHDLATAYALVGHAKESLDAYQNALLIQPKSPELLYNIGRLYDELHEEQTAVEFYRQVVALDNCFVKAWINMGLNLNYLGRYEQGLECLKQAFILSPHFDFMLGDLLHTRMHLCEWGGYEDKLKEIEIRIKDGKKVIHPFHLLSLIDKPELQKNAAEIYSIDKYRAVSDHHTFSTKPHKKIRIGYFSADFRSHATAYLMAELFELHDKNKFELIAFSYGLKEEDAMRIRLRSAFNEFIDISDKSDEDAVDIARSKELDIAVDLSGHTQDARTEIFAKRISAVQVNYLVYPGTMGTWFHDYIIADHVIIPNDFEIFYTEKVLRLPYSYQANDRKKDISTNQYSRRDLDLPEFGFIFCCFNNAYKINPTIFNLWMEILRRVDGSVLWLLGDSSVMIDNLRREAKARGIDGMRLRFANKTTQIEHLGRQRIADLFLDTFPYNAHTTASDALWVGLPIITKKGKSFASRVASSLLEAMNLTELIVYTDQQYVELAVELALNKSKLGELKSKLHANLATSSLFNTPLLVKNLENLYAKILCRD